VWFTRLLPVNVFCSVVVGYVVVHWLLFDLKKVSFSDFLKCAVDGKSESRILHHDFMMSTTGIATNEQNFAGHTAGVFTTTVLPCAQHNPSRSFS
jgi:hypothetical protein